MNTNSMEVTKVSENSTMNRICRKKNFLIFCPQILFKWYYIDEHEQHGGDKSVGKQYNEPNL